MSIFNVVGSNGIRFLYFPNGVIRLKLKKTKKNPLFCLCLFLVAIDMDGLSGKLCFKFITFVFNVKYLILKNVLYFVFFFKHRTKYNTKIIFELNAIQLKQKQRKTHFKIKPNLHLLALLRQAFEVG